MVTLKKFALVVQWIECELAEFVIEVRVLSRAQSFAKATELQASAYPRPY